MSSSIRVYDSPLGVALNSDFLVEVQSINFDDHYQWLRVPAYATDVTSINTDVNEFDLHSIAVASFDFSGPVRIKVTYTKSRIDAALIRPQSLKLKTLLDENSVFFTLDKPRD
ncbi:hypothetical protein F1880_009853 [Penicillium rolfsii]|nr:hypothetical protein F1880_009853 [Penicillium rolfsii]